MYKRIGQITAVLAILILIPVFAQAQGLGSTSGIFKSKKKSATKTTKKKASKKKATKKKTTKKKTTAKKKSTSRSKNSAKKRSSRKKASSKRRTTVRKKSNGGTAARRRSKTKNQPKKKVAISKTTPAVAVKDTPEKSKSVRSRLAEDVVITIGDPGNSDRKEGVTGKVPESSASFEEAIIDGNSARNRRLYEEAERAYKLAQSIEPNDSRAIYGLGNVFSDQQRWEDAEISYRKAVEMEPESPVAKIALSYVLTQPVQAAAVSERYVEAEKLARKSIELDPESALAYDQLGVALEMRGLIDGEAEESYRKAILLDPTFALAHAHLGRLLRKQGRALESSRSYREAIKLSVNVPAMILVADVLQSQQRYLDSEQLLRKALRRDSRNPTALHLLGRALTIRRSFDEAESVLKKAVEISPDSFESHKLLGAMYARSKALLDAEQAYLMAMTVASANEKIFLSREFERVGDSLLESERKNDAERVYRRSMTLDSNNQSVSRKLRNMGAGLPISATK